MKKKHILFFLLILISSQIQASTDDIQMPPNDNTPVNVDATLFINRIFNINTVDESYQIDGYLLFEWHDERLKCFHKNNSTEPLIFENHRAEKLINEEIWFPTFEIINIQGTQQTHNIRLAIWPDGKVVYDERFFGSFSSNMDYHKFPFDSQSFNILIETYSYDNTYLKFNNLKLLPEQKKSDHLLDKWSIKNMNTRVDDITYDHFAANGHESPTYSRAVFELKAKRLSGYFIWQVLFPLLIIIMASFMIFWIEDFSTQIGIGFTLMLTVVAFNFYSASILPKLPYNTFIETVIIIGYVFIFLGIVSVIINNLIKIKRQKEIHFLKWLRAVFPISLMISLALLYYEFYR